MELEELAKRIDWLEKERRKDRSAIADLTDKDSIDYVFYVTAHEMAHQWWGHQVIGADVQGQTMLMESMSKVLRLRHWQA